MVDPARHAESRNAFESLLRRIPGFRGYLEREYRRESDQLARTLLTDRLRGCKTSVDAVQRALVDAGRIDELDGCERLRTRLDTLIARVGGAVRGYSGVFDFVRVDEKMLDQVYEQDMALLDEVESLAKKVQALDAAAKETRQTLAELLRDVESLHRQFDRRGELLQGLGPEK